MRTFTEALRYEYNLTPHSVVVDAGCFEANWSIGIWRRYGCRVVGLEPVLPFYYNCIHRTQSMPIQVLPFGLGRISAETSFGIHGSMSGAFADGPQTSVRLTTLPLLMQNLNLDTIDVLKLNIEGSEYDVIESICDTGMAGRIKNFQIQFHNLDAQSEERLQHCRALLSRTHECDFAEKWIWDGWKLK